MGDGCLMEGISHEAGSLAGHLGLGKLIASTTTTASRSTAKGQIHQWYTDDVRKRFEAYGWHVIRERRRPRRRGVDKAIEGASARRTSPR